MRMIVGLEDWGNGGQGLRCSQFGKYYEQIQSQQGAWRYRLLVQVVYVGGDVIIEWVGTHAEYTKRRF